MPHLLAKVITSQHRPRERPGVPRRQNLVFTARTPSGSLRQKPEERYPYYLGRHATHFSRPYFTRF